MYKKPLIGFLRSPLSSVKLPMLPVLTGIKLLLLLLLFTLPDCRSVSDNGEIAGGMSDAMNPLAPLVSGLLPPEKEIPGPLAIGELLLKGNACDLGEEVGTVLPAYLMARRPDLEVVSHGNLKALLEAQKLQMMDLFDASGVESGKLLPARSLLVGFFFPLEKEGTLLHAQILDLESGGILSTARTSFPGITPTALEPHGNLPLEVEYQVTARIKGIEEELLLKEGDQLWSGDRVRISLKPNRPSNLYVFHLDSQGSAHLLFPKTTEANARIEAGELFLPSSKEYYQLDQHPGRESLLVAASLVPLVGLEELLGKLDEEAAASKDVLETLEGVGRRGLLDISKPEAGIKGLAGIMRSYSGTVWGRFDFLHLP